MNNDIRGLLEDCLFYLKSIPTPPHAIVIGTREKLIKRIEKVLEVHT